MPSKVTVAPRVVSTRMKTVTTGSLYLTGGTAGALTTAAVWHHLDTSTAVLLTLTLLAVLTGATLLSWGHRTPQWAFHVVVAAGSVLIGAAVVLSHNNTAAMGVAAVFTLCAIGVLYFFNGRQTQVHTAVQLAAVAASLSWRGVDKGVVVALMLIQLAVVVTVGRLVTRAADSVLDSLTGLPNRRGFEEHLEQATSTAQRAGTPLSVALLDVDHFKAVNDRGGHAAGDALLQHLASTWSSALSTALSTAPTTAPTTASSTGVLLSRHGGDEFALLAPGLPAARLQELCRQLHEVASPVSISVGIAELGETESCASLLRRADTALYAAKVAGRACGLIADPDDDALSAELAVAITTEAIQVVLQPILRPSTREIVGVEALARWYHPERGWISPGVFIPLAERTGQVAALGRLVLEVACRDAQILGSALSRDLLLTVNASGQQLIDLGFTDDVAAVLSRTGWPAARLVIEVTESTVEIASVSALRTLADLRELGVAVAIDDFGTGYSAFSHLDTLPADYLKLDAAFTAEITTSTRRAAMLVALLDLCDQLGLVVIAEGVETEEHASLLSLLGCPLAQGYHYARPSAVQKLAEDHRPSVGGVGESAAVPEAGAQLLR